MGRFQPGHKLAKGGKREGAGRPKKGTLPAKKAAAQIVREIIESSAQKLSKHYVSRALGKYGDRVLCHAIDKLLPEIKADEHSRPIAIQIIHEAPAIAVNGNGNGHHAEINGAGSGLTIRLGGE